MKILPLHNTKELNFLISEIQKGKRNAQKKLYNLYSPKMLSVCRMYVKDLHFAEDCMIKGFLKVYSFSYKYRNEGSFEGWMRRIMINECLNFLKKNKSIVFIEEIEIPENTAYHNESNFEAQALLDKLPVGYKVVFTLFVMENYSHKEIASLLSISESTSKSQLFKAKKKLESYLKTYKVNYE